MQPNVVVKFTRTPKLPESFGDGDFELWEKRFDICAKADRCDADEKLVRLPLLLKGRAFAVHERHAIAVSYDDLVKGIKQSLFRTQKKLVY